MPNFNQVTLIGHLTRDPELRTLPSNTSLVEFGIATSRKWKTDGGEEREDVCFVDCSCFGRAAEVLNQYARKGAPLFVQGRLKLDTWEDRNGGGKRSKLSVVVETFQFLRGRDSGDEQQQRQPQQARRPAPKRAGAGPDGPASRQAFAEKTAQSEPPFGDEQQFDPADIPF